MNLQDKIRSRLDELTVEHWWDYGDFTEIQDKGYVADLILEDVAEETFAQEDLYSLAEKIGDKHGIVINVEDLTSWIKQLKDETTRL
jgi:hypothetical protein